MSTTLKDGGPAFPVLPYYKGMTLRDYFAAAALQGFIAGRDSYTPTFEAANWAYEQADEMLAERAKAKGGSA